MGWLLSPTRLSHLKPACSMGFIKGRRIMTEMMPLMDVLETGKFVQAIKYGSAPLQRLADRRSERSLPCSNVIDECDIGLHKPPQ